MIVNPVLFTNAKNRSSTSSIFPFSFASLSKYSEQINCTFSGIWGFCCSYKRIDFFLANLSNWNYKITNEFLRAKLKSNLSPMVLVYVIEPLRVQYRIKLHECVLKRIKIDLFQTHKCKLILYWTSKRFDYFLIIYMKKL